VVVVADDGAVGVFEEREEGVMQDEDAAAEAYARELVAGAQLVGVASRYAEKLGGLIDGERE